MFFIIVFMYGNDFVIVCWYYIWVGFGKVNMLSVVFGGINGFIMFYYVKVDIVVIIY